MDEKRLDNLLECSVCLERLDERSKVLPCQHTFCIKCLTIILETRGHLQCPECRADYPNLVISKLPKNVLLVRILDNLKNIANKDACSENQENANKRDDIRPKDTAKRLSAKIKYQAQINQPCARGLYTFSSTEEGDLPFKKGDIVSLAHEIDANWYEGSLGNKRGSIPKNFLETLVPLPKIDDDTLKNPFAKALYSYCKEEPELISFREGDIIGVIKKVDSNWFEGILGGQYGIFPFNFVQLNKAAKDLVSGDSSPSTSSSDDEIESTRKKRSRRARAKASSPTAATAAAANSKDVFGPSPWVKRDQVPTTNDPITKRHTIHIENPDEQQRQSRRALNLSDNVEQPQIRTRAMSQGRRPSESSSNESRTLASTVLLSRALRNSDEQLQLTMTTAQSTVPCVSATTSIPVYRTSENLSRSLSTSPSNSIPNSIGTGEMYTALFTYSPARDDELALIQGDQYWLIEKHLDGWFKGIHVRSQQTGVFPGNYVKLSSQVTQQMLRNIGTHPSRAVIGYGSNPSSPNVPTSSSPMFNFPPQRMNANNEETSASGNTISASGENSSPRSNGVSGFMKMFKKNKTKRQTPPTPATPQSPPSYYHSSMPGPMARPSPNVPAEPPPPYTPTPITTLSSSSNDDVIINTSSTISTGEKFRAVASYPALHENELALRLGDLVWVTKKHVDGWYTGKSARTGTTGVFPSTFVEPQA